MSIQSPNANAVFAATQLFRVANLYELEQLTRALGKACADFAAAEDLYPLLNAAAELEEAARDIAEARPKELF